MATHITLVIVTSKLLLVAPVTCGADVDDVLVTRPIEVMALVVPPTTIWVIPGAKEIGVPDIVIAEPPGVRVSVPITKLPPLLAVTVCPLIVSTAGIMGVGIAGKDSNDPETVMPGLPGVRV